MPLGGSSHLPIPHFVPVPPYELGLRGSKNCAHLSRTRDMPELDVVRWRRQAVWTGRGGKEGQGVNLPLSLQRLLLRVSGGGLCCPPSSLCDPVATRKRTGGHGINSWLPRASQPTALSLRGPHLQGLAGTNNPRSLQPGPRLTTPQVRRPHLGLLPCAALRLGPAWTPLSRPLLLLPSSLKPGPSLGATCPSGHPLLRTAISVPTPMRPCSVPPSFPRAPATSSRAFSLDGGEGRCLPTWGLCQAPPGPPRTSGPRPSSLPSTHHHETPVHVTDFHSS